MSVSVIINSFNRRAGLEDTLEGLRRQTFVDFEVVVVHGPSSDGTARLLAGLEGVVRVVDFPERHLARSRNAGIAAAAGDVVAFIDDDAVPSPRWLEDLVTGYDDAEVAGVGGVVLDSSGVRAQYRYSLCHRSGALDFTREPPFDAFVRPGADPFLYLQGTNCSFRRVALVAVGGFDEEIEYNYDEAELCLQLIDAGWRLRALPDAVVHHRFLPSERRTARAFTDPYLEVKNRVYFGLRHAPQSDALIAANRDLDRLRLSARATLASGNISEDELAHSLGRADAGFHAGLRRGLTTAPRARRALGANPSTAFLPYPVLAPSPRRRVALMAPADADLVAAGHEVHVLEPAGADAPYRIAFDGGAWVHTVPVRPRWLPEVDGSSLRARLERAAALRGAMERIRAREEAELLDLAGEYVVAPPAELPARLMQAGGLEREAAATVARRLDEPDRFPTDYEVLLRACLAQREDADFVACLYAAVLDRPLDPYGKASLLIDLQAGGDRIAAVERVACSAEARDRGVDPRFVQRLPPVSLARAEAQLRSAWLLEEDGAFAAAVQRALLGREAEPEPVQAPLDRRRHVDELLRSTPVRVRVAGADLLPPEDAQTRAELAAALNAIAVDPPERFVEGAHRLLLGRASDPVATATLAAALAWRSRRWLIVRLASSPEAAARGVPLSVVTELLRRSPRYRRDTIRPRVGGRLRALKRRLVAG